MGLVAFLIAELGWLLLLLLGAPVWAWLMHWLVVALGEVIALPGLATRDRRAWVHFLTVLAAASMSSYVLGLIPLFLSDALAFLALCLWAIIAVLFLRFLWQVKGARRELLKGDVAAVIVLGAGLIGDRPGPLLARRVERAVEVARKLSVPLICSGGQGPDEPVTEASAMASYARELGAEQVYEEDQAKNTRENVIFSIAVAEGISGHAPRKVAVVTSDFHVHRAQQTAGRVAQDCEVMVLGARTPESSLPASLVREFVAQLADLVPRRR